MLVLGNIVTFWDEYLDTIAKINPVVNLWAKIKTINNREDADAMDKYLWLYGTLISRVLTLEFKYVKKYINICKEVMAEHLADDCKYEMVSFMLETLGIAIKHHSNDVEGVW